MSIKDSMLHADQFGEMYDRLKADLATERAAREKAEADLRLLREQAGGTAHMRNVWQARAERADKRVRETAMPDLITNDDLAAWDAAAEKAMPGPWATVRQTEQVRGEKDFWWGVTGPRDEVFLHDGMCDEADAHFIAIARTAIPRLIAALREARREVQAWEIACAPPIPLQQLLERAAKELARADAEVQRWRDRAARADAAAQVCDAARVFLTMEWTTDDQHALAKAIAAYKRATPEARR